MPQPSDSAFPVVLLEIVLNLAGLVLLWRYAARPSARPAPRLLSAWDAPLGDFFLFSLLAAAGGFGLAAGAGRVLRDSALDADLRLLIAGGRLWKRACWPGTAVYCFGFRRRTGPALPSAPALILIGGAVTFLAALPVMNGVSLAWQTLLQLCGLPVEKQEMVDLLVNTRSPATRGLLIALAVLGAPLMEEIVFRAGIFRYLRTRLPRWAAFLMPALLFGAAHGNLAYFAPLTVLGLLFSVAYERTGRIGTTIVAHSLFNLNTIVLILGGITG